MRGLGFGVWSLRFGVRRAKSRAAHHISLAPNLNPFPCPLSQPDANSNPFRALSPLRLCGESVLEFSASFCLCSLFFSILRRHACLQRVQKASRNAGNFVHRSLKQCCIPLRRFIESADLSHKLKRGSSDFLGSRRRIEIKEGLNVPAHFAWVWLCVRF